MGAERPPRTVETEVLIVGAGPSGMVSALCLAARGVSSVVIERREGLQTHPKAHELSPRSIEILGGLGVPYDELAEEASPHDDASRVVFCGTVREEFGRIDLNDGDGARKYREHLAAPRAYLNLSQVELERRLQARVLRCEHAELLYNHRWDSLTQDGERVTSRVTDRVTGEAYEVRSRYVIAADGASSRVRAAIGARMVGPEKLREFVNAYFRADLSAVVGTRAKLYFVFAPKVAGSALIAHHVERRWVFHLPVQTPHERVEDYTPGVMRQRINAALGRDDVEVEIASMSRWTMTAQVADRFRDGRVFLVGDAAHHLPPTGGLGMNSGIGDAHNLCWKLAMALEGGESQQLLASYESERRPVVQTNCDESLRNFESVAEVVEAFGVKVEDIEWVNEQMATGLFASLPDPIRAWGRRQLERHGARVLARYDRDPAVRERVRAAVARQRPHFDRIGLDLGYAYETGAVVPDGSAEPRASHRVSEYLPSTRPGSRFPHFWLDGNQKKRSSHTLVDYRRSTLVLGAEVEAVGDELTALADDLGVALCPLCEPLVAPSCRPAAHAFCQIEPDGAPLLRPDGHVAWRQKAGVKLTHELLRSIVREGYGV